MLPWLHAGDTAVADMLSSFQLEVSRPFVFKCWKLHGGVLNGGMTRCSDKEDEEQSDDGAEKLSENTENRRKGGKHVSFPPDEQIVSVFAEHRSPDRKGELLLPV